MNDYYPFVNEPLPYAYNALRPYIDAETMYIHHNKYLQAYIDNLNEIMEQNPYMQQYSLVQMLSNTSLIPPELKVSIGDNAGGVFNHRMYFEILCTDRNEIEDGILKALLVQSFGSLEQFTREFKDAALSVFGSGYAWLTYNKGRLYIFTMADENTPFQMGFVPILLVDMWEHAYFLQNLNRREDYLDSFMQVIDWEKVETNLMNANPVFESNGILIDYNESAD
ncbi:MAG: superoxide dismutase [Lachnospiraceae bacterium]